MATQKNEHLKQLLKAIKAADDDDDIIQLCHEITKITRKEKSWTTQFTSFISKKINTRDTAARGPKRPNWDCPHCTMNNLGDAVNCSACGKVPHADPKEHLWICETCKSENDVAFASCNTCDVDRHPSILTQKQLWICGTCKSENDVSFASCTTCTCNRPTITPTGAPTLTPSIYPTITPTVAPTLTQDSKPKCRLCQKENDTGNMVCSKCHTSQNTASQDRASQDRASQDRTSKDRASQDRTSQDRGEPKTAAPTQSLQNGTISDKWTCDTCYELNNTSTMECNSCGQSRDDQEPSRVQATKNSTTSIEDSFVENHYADAKEEQTDITILSTEAYGEKTEPPKEYHEAARVTMEKSAEANVSETAEWECDLCGQINDHSRACDTCGEIRTTTQSVVLPVNNQNHTPGGVAAVRNDIPPPDVTRAEENINGWSCPGCTFVNKLNRPGCEICGEEKP